MRVRLASRHDRNELMHGFTKLSQTSHSGVGVVLCQASDRIGGGEDIVEHPAGRRWPDTCISCMTRNPATLSLGFSTQRRTEDILHMGRV